MSKEYTLIGGNGTRVSPLDVNENGTYEAGDSRAFNPVRVNTPVGPTTLSGLTDVDISNPSNGQTLVYNAVSGKWENGAGVFNINVTSIDDQNVLDKTYNEIKSAYLSGSKCIINREDDYSDPESEAIDILHSYLEIGMVSEEETGAPGQTSMAYLIRDINGNDYITDSPTGYPVNEK